MLNDLRLRIRSLFHRNRVESELDDELRFHLDRQIEKYVRSGLSFEEATRRARLESGGLEQQKENCRDARGTLFFETLLQDLLFALRMLRKNPGFTAVAVFTLALGIGANTAIFSVIDSVLLSPLPYHEPDNLVMVWETNSQHPKPHNTVSPPNFLDWQSRNTVFSGMAYIYDGRDNFTGMGEPEEVVVQNVSANFFSVLGVNPILGPGFTPENGQAGHDNVVILSYGLWNERFAADPTIVGKSIVLNGRPQTIVGVAPQDFNWFIKDGSLTSAKPRLWSPFVFPQSFHDHKQIGRFLTVAARLKPGVTSREAQAEMTAIAAQLEHEYPDFDGHWGINVVPLRQ